MADDLARAEPGCPGSSARECGNSRLRRSPTWSRRGLLRPVRAGGWCAMIFTLTWKEVREHEGIWITMIFMSVLLGLGMGKLVALDNPSIAVAVSAFTILGMAATYGVVCGSMMLAGEHEG